MDSGRTLIISVGDYSSEQAEERGIYAFPSSYGRDHCDFVAFYRGKPVGAITHYAEVREVTTRAGMCERHFGLLTLALKSGLIGARIKWQIFNRNFVRRRI